MFSQDYGLRISVIGFLIAADPQSVFIIQVGKKTAISEMWAGEGLNGVLG